MNASQYHVLSFRLAVEPEEGVPLSSAFGLLNRRMNNACKCFRKYHELSFEIEALGVQSIQNACEAVGATSRNKMFIIIDEYDRLPNAALSLGVDVLDEYTASLATDAKVTEAIIEEGRTAADHSTVLWSPIRGLYSTLKDVSDGLTDFVLQELRSFTTGISPVALADASLFSIGFNLTTLPEAADAVCFITEDVKAAIECATMVPEQCRDPLLQLMRAWFNDYRVFTDAYSITLFHPMLVMNLLSDVQNVESTRMRLSEILSVQLHGCRRLPAGYPGRRLPLPEGPPSPVRYPPSGFMDRSNVTETSELLSLAARRKATKSPFTYNELFHVGAKIPSHLLQTAFKQRVAVFPCDGARASSGPHSAAAALPWAVDVLRHHARSATGWQRHRVLHRPSNQLGHQFQRSATADGALHPAALRHEAAGRPDGAVRVQVFPIPGEILCAAPERVRLPARHL